MVKKICVNIREDRADVHFLDVQKTENKIQFRMPVKRKWNLDKPSFQIAFLPVTDTYIF